MSYLGTCTNTDNGAKDSYGDGCDEYVYYPGWCGGYDDSDFVSTEMCCPCGGGNKSGNTPDILYSCCTQEKYFARGSNKSLYKYQFGFIKIKI